MNIGLLITELEDQEVKRICIGANQAAKDKDITLVIIPGKYLYADTPDKDNIFAYQNSVLFDFCMSGDFDALIIDVDRIGSRTTILKKEAFLKKYENIPVLTLTEYEGYESVNSVNTEKDQLEQLGYEAVCDAIFFVKNQVLPPLESAKQFTYVEAPETEALHGINMVSELFFHKQFEEEKAYTDFVDLTHKGGIRTSGVMLYDKRVRNTLKYPWTKPEQINIKSGIINGVPMHFEDGSMVISTEKIISTFAKKSSGTYILGDIYVGEYQLGLLLTEFTEATLINHFFDSLVSIVTGIARISGLEKELQKTTEELYEVQEELARDDSVLEHIGDQDYLTGGLNRRGFFAKAYDFLKANFTPGKNALVAYIHMESLKQINDMYGHEEGDRAVKRVARILEEVFNDGIYGRIRGDEFAVILVSDEEGKAESLREQMSEQNARLLTEPNRYINHLQYSICEFGHEENLSLREMLKETDENLQKIKGSM